MSLPNKLKIFGENTEAVIEPLPRHISRLQVRGGLLSAAFFLTGEPEDWDFHDWSAAPLFRQLGRDGTPVTMAMQAAAVTRLEIGQKLDLSRLLHRAGGALHTVTVPLNVKGREIIAVLEDAGGRRAAVASSDEQELIGSSWGSTDNGPILTGAAPEIELGNRISLDKLVQFNEGNAIDKGVATQLDGKASEFGQKFWALVKAMRPQSFKAGMGLSKVLYRDRYLRSPLMARLLFEVVSAAPGYAPTTTLHVQTAHDPAAFRPRRGTIEEDWADDTLRKEVFEALLPGAAFELMHRRDLRHRRSLELTFEDGRAVELCLDQGFGAWRTPRSRSVRFDAVEDAVAQARKLRREAFFVEMHDGGRFPSAFTLRWK